MVTGIVSAPWWFLAGRALRSDGLLNQAVKADSLYARGIHAMAKDGSASIVGQFYLAAQLASASDPRIGARIKQLMSISESQVLQDIVCILSTNEKRGGYFVEVGVGGGKNISNTYMLEKHFGWSGLLVEPNRSSHASIEACRGAVLERRAAASSTGKRLTFQEVSDGGEHSRIAGTGGHPMSKDSIVEYEVETVTLDDILRLNNAPKAIDYLSLDTEGSELDILDGLDLDTYSFQFMTIEHNFDPFVMRALRTRFEPRGYKVVLEEFSGFDAWFVHESAPSPFRALPTD